MWLTQFNHCELNDEEAEASVIAEYEAQISALERKVGQLTTDSSYDSLIYPNFYRNLIPDRPDTVLIADFTYIRIAAGFCYLAVILSACSRKVAVYALSGRLDTPLALAALNPAIEKRKPPPGGIH